MNTLQMNRIFKALSDETRLRIICLLAKRTELCVCELIQILNMGQSKVSRHLAYLKKAGLVQDRKQGLWSYYSLAKTQGKFHHQMISYLSECFNEVPTLKKDAAALKNPKTCG